MSMQQQKNDDTQLTIFRLTPDVNHSPLTADHSRSLQRTGSMDHRTDDATEVTLGPGLMQESGSATASIASNDEEFPQ